MNRRNALLSVAGGLVTTAVAANEARPAPPHAPGRRQVVARDGTRLFHRDWGDGRPILFVAGWTLNSEAWAYQAAELSDQGFRCIAYDRRSHGRSDDPGRGYDLDTLSDDLDSVVEQLDLRDVTVVAHSFGALEATRYLSRHGSARVRRMLLLAPVTPCLAQKPDNPDAVPRAAFEANWALWRRDFPRWVDDNADPFFLPDTSQGIKEWTKDMMLHTPLRATLALGRTMAEADVREEMKRLDAPVLVIQGDRDASAPLPLTGQRTAALIPGARLKVYAGAPHGLYFTHAERLNRDIAAFARG